MGNGNFENFANSDLNDRFSGLSSNSSLDYANYLFLDDSLFFNSFSISADDYVSDDFPGSDLVDRNKVFSKPGYNVHPLPALPFSYASLVLGICSFPLVFLTLVFLGVSFIAFDNDSNAFAWLLIFSFIDSALAFVMGISVLRRPRSRFYRGLKQAKVGIFTSSISLGLLLWICILGFG